MGAKEICLLFCRKFTLVEGAIKEFRIEGLSLWNALFHKKVVAKDLKIIRPQLRLVLNNKKTGTIGQHSKLSIRNVLIEHGDTETENHEKTKLFSSKEFNIQLKGISEYSSEELIPITFENFRIDSKNLILGLSDLHQVTVAKISAKNQIIDIENYKVESLNPQDKDKNQIDVQGKNIHIKGYRFKNKSLEIDSLLLLNPRLEMLINQQSQ